MREFLEPGALGAIVVFAVLPEKNIVFIALNTLKANENLSRMLWQEITNELASEYPLPITLGSKTETKMSKILKQGCLGSL
ncbi:hypothetical protein [Legionella sainthelensi]|uniref:Uncharacterized protein n=1 Tax=Legionella sainthelensi TaxID=28087 RepID=A0A2H5FMJ9_9GAMM|nr:hypothetical protein [Legionella sainthelensi]AUH72762.1 hypothetical protein CAB17_12420 [Legionella sainthelensi]